MHNFKTNLKPNLKTRLETRLETRLKTGLFFSSFILIGFVIATAIFTLCSFFPIRPYSPSFLHAVLSSATFSGIFAGPVSLIVFFLGIKFSPLLFKQLQSHKKSMPIFLGIYGSFLTLIILDIFITLFFCYSNFQDKYQHFHSLSFGIANGFEALFIMPFVFLVSFIVGGVIGTPLAILAVYLFKKLVVKKNSPR